MVEKCKHYIIRWWRNVNITQSDGGEMWWRKHYPIRWWRNVNITQSDGEMTLPIITQSDGGEM